MNLRNKLRLSNIVNEWVPPRLLRLIRQRNHYFQPKSIRKSIASNKVFHNIHQGERCFILATGPSISGQDLMPLSKETCISVSDFYLHPSAHEILPKYNVIAPNHAPFKFESLAKLVDDINLIYNGRNHLFSGNTNYQYSFSKYITDNPEKLENNLTLINYQSAPSLDEYNFKDDSLWDITKTPFAPRTVVYSAIQVAAYMGFSEIYLLGCDHDYLMRYFNKTFDSTHFYNEEKSSCKEEEVNSEKFLDAFTLENWFQEYYFRWKQYRLMNEYLKNRGQIIYNATDGGMLDVFPRVKLHEIL